MFGFSDFKHGTFTLFMLFIVFFFLVFPANVLLPAPFLDFIPSFIQDKSLITYFQLHLSFFVSLIIPIGLLTIIIYLWRKA